MLKKIEMNRLNKLFRMNLTAKILLVLFFEVVPIIAILAKKPFDGSSIQLYELFIFSDLLAVLLFKSWSVFFVAISNSFFIVASLLYQSHTAAFNQDLQLQFWPILLRPIAVQFLVTIISYLWIANTKASMKDVHLAEIKATEARQRAERQKAETEKSMQLLQNSVERIVYKHATVMNQGLFTKIPLTEYEPMLWPLINAFNSLQNRLQHTYQIEHELQDLQGAISMYVELIHHGKFSIDQPSHTHTPLDMLLNSLCEKQKTYPDQASDPGLWALENATTLRLKLEDIWITHSQELYAQGKQIKHGWNADCFKYIRGSQAYGAVNHSSPILCAECSDRSASRDAQ